MATPARTGALAAAAGWTRAAAWAPDWRAAFSTALAREVEQRRFFLWIPVAAMGGVALNLSADREPVMWLPALMTALFAGLAWFCRARPLALGLSLAIAALFAGFLSMSLRTARVAAPVLDRIRIVRMQGFVEEADLRTVGARMVIGVVNADGMPQEKVPRRVRVTTRNTPDVAAGDYVEFQGAPAAPRGRPSQADTLARDAFFAGVGAVGSTLGPIQRLAPPGDASWLPALRRHNRSSAQSPGASGSTRSLAAMRAPSPRRWSRGSATSCPTTPRISSEKPASSTSSRSPACR